MQLPQRTSLVDQLVEILRTRLESGEWKTQVTGEHKLCKQLQVSRPTLRKALTVLAGEGWIRAERGLGWRVVAKPSARMAAVQRANKIGLLCFVSLNEATHFSLYQIDELQNHLQRAGYPVEIFAGPEFASQNYRMALRRLADNSGVSHWILLGPTPQVQEWFVAQKLTAFASATSDPRVPMPCLAVDLHALYRHAVGTLVKRGHRHIGWVVPLASLKKSDIAMREFQAAVRSYQERYSLLARTITHDGSPNEVRRQIDGVLRMEPRPTALLVLRPSHALTTVSHLVYRRVRVPQDISVLSVGYEPFLQHFTPSLAHYVIDTQGFVRQLCRLVLPWIETGRCSMRVNPILPRFVDGETLASAA